MTRPSATPLGIYWTTDRKIRAIENRRLANGGVTKEDLTDTPRIPPAGCLRWERKEDAMETEKTTVEVMNARVMRHDTVLNEHEGRIRDLERNYSAEYQWRQATDKTLTAINAKLEALLVEDGKTFHTAKMVVLTTFLSTIVGYVVGVLLR